MKARATGDVSPRKAPSPETQTSTPPSLLLPAFEQPVSANAEEIEIRELAFRIYEERGRLDGYALEDWLQAENIIRQRGKLFA